MKRKVHKTRATVLSDLPESALHHILSHLPLKDSIRTSVLSKQWNSALKSNPFLDFAQPRDRVGSPGFKKRLREFFNFVDRSLKHFDRNKLGIERMHLDMSYINRRAVPLINTWLPIALHNGVSNLHFHANFSLEGGSGPIYPLPESTFVVNSSLSSGSFKFFRLKNLKLSSVSLGENLVCDIIQNCPNINHLSLWDICGLKALNISKLDKLVSLQVLACSPWIRSFYVNAPSLEHVSFVFSGEVFDLTSCCNLRKIKFSNDKIAFNDARFHQHISKFPLLEDLEISCCHSLQRIKISLQRLKHLRVYRCNGVKVIEIDAPSLECFELALGNQDVLILVSSNGIRCSMHFSYVMGYERSWSLKLRESLGVPFNGVNFDIWKHSIKFTFGPHVSREVVNPNVAKVDCLDLTGLRIVGSFRWVTLLDTLLSGCHPKIVSMTVDTSDKDNCVNVFRKMLVQSECQLCCNLVHCKCWRRHLKAAKIKSINGIELNIKDVGKIDHKQFLRVLDTFLSIPMDSEVQFKLNWDHSYITPQEESLTRFSISSE